MSPSNTISTRRVGVITVDGFTFTVRQSAYFADVPPTHPFFAEICQISANGITLGCADSLYCPERSVTREEMAVFIIRALGMPNPPQHAQQRFQDVLPASFGYAFVEEFAKRGITNGCGADIFCPGAPVTRDQMAIFLIRALGVFNPPQPAAQRFLDVPPDRFGYAFIEELAARQITYGCTAETYCPGDAVSRGQMAAFLSRAFKPCR